MTIVLQHQFWDLTVTDDAFEVGLSFNGIPERLFVPFAAIKGFADPSVKFGLQFAEVTEGEQATAGAAAPPPAVTPRNAGERGTVRRRCQCRAAQAGQSAPRGRRQAAGRRRRPPRPLSQEIEL